MALKKLDKLLDLNNYDNINNKFQNIEAEMALIGCILWDNRNYEKIADFVKEDLFIDKNNCQYFPNLTNLINKFQGTVASKISLLLHKDLSKSFVRLEIIGDKKGFWLKPHKDIPEKLMTMMIWANPNNEHENLGTDLYNEKFELVKTVKYHHNNGYFFSSENDTWHGLEMKEIKKERRCIQINYVSFETDWPVIS